MLLEIEIRALPMLTQHPLCSGATSQSQELNKGRSLIYLIVVEAQDPGIIGICLVLVRASWLMVPQCYDHMQKRLHGETGNQRDQRRWTLETSLERKTLTPM